MILPIYIYGQPILKKKAEVIEPGYENLETLISDMWETMYTAKGVGLAAPQIGRSIRLFVVDTTQLENEERDFKGIKQVFINARKVNEDGSFWEYEEGCLSIPQIRADVERPERIHLRFQDETFKGHDITFDGLTARVIQHEYDHIEGILFTELIKPIKRRLVRRKLENLRKGIVDVDYPVRVTRR
ncbi:MAG TPA: peptide deformylase [Saprospiraceae bacterium]|nr:peptide deformylase [Saprospiraceae bacterium]